MYQKLRDPKNSDRWSGCGIMIRRMDEHFASVPFEWMMWSGKDRNRVYSANIWVGDHGLIWTIRFDQYYMVQQTMAHQNKVYLDGVFNHTETLPYRRADYKLNGPAKNTERAQANEFGIFLAYWDRELERISD